jgi:hypothetical protein
MPSFEHHGEIIEYAEESELLDFANRVRAAGGGEPVAALFPAIPSDPNSCLIAKALNFGCTVDGWYGPNRDENSPQGGLRWVMYIDNDYDEVEKIAEAVDCEMIPLDYSDQERDNGEYMPGFVLPERIGNAACAFDHADEGWVVAYRKSVS